MFGCLQVEISVVPIVLKPTISLYCGLGQAYSPLLVDEGYLLVEDNGVVSFLCVDKK